MNGSEFRAPDILVVLSGGLDSTTLLYQILDKGYNVPAAVSFNYGQRHMKELEYAYDTCKRLGVEHFLIDLWGSGLTEALSASESSLVSDTEVPEGHYAEENMKSTVVPNRNMIMLSIAGGIAVAHGCSMVATAVHAGDHFIYPDCRPEFIAKTSVAMALGNEGFGTTPFLGVLAPYTDMTKEDIAFEALSVGVPLDKTWSCYKGGAKHCGKCGTCVERLEAIDGAIRRYQENRNVPVFDNTEYEDTEFWKQAVAAAKGD